jgi:hypothetical protein
VTGPSLREVYADGLVMWHDLCAECAAGFEAWQCAPNPGNWANPKIQANPQLLAFLASCRVTGPDPQQWRDTISHQLLIIRRICTRWHASRRLWESLEPVLGYGYEGRGFPSQTPTCLACYAGRACPRCGSQGPAGLIPRSVDPIWLRCCACGAERSVPFHRCTWDRPEGTFDVPPC